MDHLRTRRQFVQGVGAAGLALVGGCALPFAAPPPPVRVHRIAYLTSSAANAEGSGLMAALREGLRDLGYVEGQNLLIYERIASGVDQLAEPAAELVRLEPEVFVVPAVPVVRAVQAASSTVPIVSTGSGTLDLVVSGVAASVARPGGNVTGLNVPPLVGKRLQLLQQAVPTLSRVAVLFDPTISTFRREPYVNAALSLGLPLEFVSVGEAEDLGAALEAATRAHADGLFLSALPRISSNQAELAELAIQRRLPSMWALSDAVGRGGLMAYGPNRADLFRRAASYVDKILKGRKPADLPVEQPREFDFAINLTTAQALGLTIPRQVLAQATEVLQ
jgi:putative ABC transport system substrate-binding protein